MVSTKLVIGWNRISWPGFSKDGCLRRWRIELTTRKKQKRKKIAHKLGDKIRRRIVAELQEKAFLEGAKSYRASRTWPVEKGMPRVHSWRVLCWGRWCAKFQPAWSDPLRKHSLVRQTWVALAVVSFVSVLRAGELLEKIRQILGVVTVTLFFYFY